MGADPRPTGPPALDPDLEAALRQGTAVAHWAACAPDRAAVVSTRGTRTFAQLDEEANRLVRALRDRGLAAGDAVAILSGNRPEFAATWAACSRAGFRLTTVNWHLTPEEAAYIVADCGARALVADAVHAGAVPEAGVVDVRLAVGGDVPGHEPWAEVLADHDGSPISDPTLGTVMLYTSGTTGHPKGVAKPPDPDAAVHAVAMTGYGDGHVHLCTGPLYHAAPFQISMVAPLSAGVPVVLMERWDPSEMLALVERHRVTHTHVVPTMFHRLLALPDDERGAHDLSSLQAVVHGAAPCPVHVKQRVIEWLGPVLLEYYAATEGAGTRVGSRAWLRKPGTVGRADPHLVRVGDDDGEPLPPGTEGLVWLRALGNQRFAYHGDEAKTRAAFRGDWYTLGDVGRIDDDGFLYLTDRSANLIISGGVNVYPAEIDAVLLEHPAVADAATIGVPDDEWGESVLALVEPRPGVDRAALPDELVAFCRERLAHFKCPRRVELVDDLPRDENGKIYKRRLRDRYRSAG